MLAVAGCATPPEARAPATAYRTEATTVPPLRNAAAPVPARERPAPPSTGERDRENHNSEAQFRHSVGDAAADYALRMVGKPYRFGGSSPSTGFDCSGLVQFSFRQAGSTVPRTTDAQRHASKPIRLSHLQRGDLVFFDQEGKKNSHVGIYVGGREFVHAPSSGKQVRRDRLDVLYWRNHISEARRFGA